MSGFDVKEGLRAGKNGLIFGAAIGAAAGAYTGYKQAGRSHIDPWNGKPTEAVKTGTNALVKTSVEITEHAAQRMEQRGITEKMVQTALKKGAKFYDPKNGVTN